MTDDPSVMAACPCGHPSREHVDGRCDGPVERSPVFPDGNCPCTLSASAALTPREVMLRARYGEPVDTYTWDLVVDRMLSALRNAGFTIMGPVDESEDRW